MKNNRLHIIYNESLFAAKCNKNGATISFRCTRLERAQQIVQSTNPEVIDDAMFKDAEGNTYSWKELRNSSTVASPARVSQRITKKNFISRLIDTIQAKKAKKFSPGGKSVQK